MRIERLGTEALVLLDLEAPPAAVAAAIEDLKWPDIVDIVPCQDSVGVYFSGQARPLPELKVSHVDRAGRVHTIPVCYDLGEDLALVADHLGLTESEVISFHTAQPFPCFAIGFCPGFAYLGPLPTQLAGMPRLDSPRTRTIAGSVGLTADQTAVYPLPRPGGWPIIGRSPLTLVNVEQSYFPIRVGDQVRFVAIDGTDFEARLGERLPDDRRF